MSNKKNSYSEPWKDFPAIWPTESSFWTWVRGGLRKLWSKHPIKLEYIKANRKQITNPNPKGKKQTVWGMTCECCGTETIQSNIQIDHISDTGGKFTGLDDIREYAAYLFLINFDSIRAVCLDCHQAINLAQKLGISFEEALVEKQVIAFCKQPTKKQLAYFQELGYNNESISNAGKRRKLFKEVLSKEKSNG